LSAVRSETASPRRAIPLILRSLLAAAWFAFVFFVAFPAGVIAVFGIDWVPPAGANRWLGGAVLVACHALLVTQVRVFIVDGAGTHAPLDPPRRLVKHGVYARIRNPMYWIYVGIILGEALLYRSLALAGYALAFWALAHAYVVAVEERSLKRRFGAEYEAYAARVGRWLPQMGVGDDSSSPRRSLPVEVRASASTTRNSRGTL
jgi:protein-S-isoprenylcysteine O-methyltransferase Ste14